MKKFNLDDIKSFLEDGINGGIHIEPCTSLLKTLEDKIYASLAMKYITINNYTKSIYDDFYQAKNEDLIDFKLLKGVKGAGLLPAWTLVWNKKN